MILSSVESFSIFMAFTCSNKHLGYSFRFSVLLNADLSKLFHNKLFMCLYNHLVFLSNVARIFSVQYNNISQSKGIALRGSFHKIHNQMKRLSASKEIY